MPDEPLDPVDTPDTFSAYFGTTYIDNPPDPVPPEVRADPTARYRFHTDDGVTHYVAWDSVAFEEGVTATGYPQGFAVVWYGNRYTEGSPEFPAVFNGDPLIHYENGDVVGVTADMDWGLDGHGVGGFLGGQIAGPTTIRGAVKQAGENPPRMVPLIPIRDATVTVEFGALPVPDGPWHAAYTLYVQGVTSEGARTAVAVNVPGRDNPSFGGWFTTNKFRMVYMARVGLALREKGFGVEGVPNLIDSPDFFTGTTLRVWFPAVREWVQLTGVKITVSLEAGDPLYPTITRKEATRGDWPAEPTFELIPATPQDPRD